MQVLYQAELSGNDIDEALKNLLESEKYIPETAEFAKKLIAPVWENRAELDAIIKKLSIDWPLDRISKVDLSILRLALQELRTGETPPSVVVDEAVELAKKYSSAESAGFINGILGTYLKKS